MIIDNPRYLALMVLCDNEKSQIPLDRTINGYAEEFNLLLKRDRALANTIIYGVLRARGKLDWIISHFSSRKVNTLDPEILYLLRIGLFQIIFLDKIPTSAAVNTSVEMAKKVSNKWAAGFVNAVLRKAGTKYSTLVLPDIKTDPAFFLSVEKSFPLWLGRRWVKRFGLDKALKLCDTINKIPFITVRTNTIKIDRNDLAGKLANKAETVFFPKYAENGISMLKPSSAIHEMEAFKKGYFQVQDEAAQIVSSMLDPQPGEIILDACAGLGGKTGHIAQLMENRGSVTAMDINKDKLEILEKEMERLGISIVLTKHVDILDPGVVENHRHNANEIVNNRHGADYNSFDRVLLDAPCTGLGVLRRNPDSKWARSLKDVKRLAQKQKAMLFKAADFVKPGGTLVYSVCSCEPEENEYVIDEFLNKRPDFIVNDDSGKLFFNGHKADPDSGPDFLSTKYETPINSFTGKSFYNRCGVAGKSSDRPYGRYIKFDKTRAFKKGFFRTYPDHSDMDGFFAVAMKRKQ